jgi:excisionase family DNA binding protein
MKIEIEESDIQAIAETVFETMKPFLTGVDNEKSSGSMMDLKELCAYLKVKPKWVHERTYLKEIPFLKLSNKQLRFRKRDIDKWLESMRISAINPLSSKVRLIK